MKELTDLTYQSAQVWKKRAILFASFDKIDKFRQKKIIILNLTIVSNILLAKLSWPEESGCYNSSYLC